jgi:curved DNA-binding protein
MNYYEILGVGDKATVDEIKRAYRKLASQHHPDKGGDKDKFQEIQAAYDTLSNDQKRHEYDMQLSGRGGSGTQFHWHSGDINDIFRQFGFGGGIDPFGGFRQQQPQPRRNRDLRIEIPIPLVSTLEEQSKTIQVSTTNGEKSTLEVKIPRGITTGTNIKYPNLGDNLFNTLPRGDLYIQFRVHDAENFIINGVDLYTQVSVNCLLATIGGTVVVAGLDNKQFEIALPKGTQPGMKFRIPEQGLYQLNSNQRGNLYVEVAVTVPQNLTQTQIETIQSIINEQ